MRGGRQPWEENSKCRSMYAWHLWLYAVLAGFNVSANIAI